MEGKSLVAQYSEVIKQLKSHEAEIEAIKPKEERLRAQLLEEMLANGISKTSCAGITVYIHRQWWAGRAKDVSTQDACDGLKQAGLSEYVKEGFNTQALSAYVREMRELEAGRFPDDKEAAEKAAETWVENFIRESGNTIKVSEKVDLRTKKA